jgi:type III secretion protein X
MSDVRIGSGNFFKQGLDGISHLAATETTTLPGQQDLAPADQAKRPLLEELLALPNMESFLEEAIRPDLNDPDLLMPGNFKKTHDAVLQGLQQGAEDARSSDPDGAKVLNRAIRVLNDDKALRDLVHDYCNALHQG